MYELLKIYRIQIFSHFNIYLLLSLYSFKIKNEIFSLVIFKVMWVFLRLLKLKHLKYIKIYSIRYCFYKLEFWCLLWNILGLEPPNQEGFRKWDYSAFYSEKLLLKYDSSLWPKAVFHYRICSYFIGKSAQTQMDMLMKSSGSIFNKDFSLFILCVSFK